MQLATLIVAALGALFTALAAGAAWLTARTAQGEARRRAEPYVAAGTPAVSQSGDEVVVTIKNLGLGPARLLRVLVEGNSEAAGFYTSPGLAPMEPETVLIPLTLWTKVDPPRFQDLRLSGTYQDAAGGVHPLYVQAHARPVKSDRVEQYEAFASLPEIARRHALKVVVRTDRQNNASFSNAAWMRYWRWIESEGISPAAVEEEVAGAWEGLGGAADRFVRRSNLILTDDDRRRWEAEQAEVTQADQE